MRNIALIVIFACLLHGEQACATVFGQIQGVVHDPQHRPIANATVEIHSRSSEYAMTTRTTQEGSFQFLAVPLGEYIVKASETGFSSIQQPITLASGTSPILHFELHIASSQESVSVTSDMTTAESATPTTLIDRVAIAQTPGAGRSDGMQMITDYVPGAYMTHDMLHIRGGHQVSWLLDGVEIPNTNIGSNIGPQIDPKDIDYLEIQRGSYSADIGDRTYGAFNIAPRTGFERNRQAEVVLSAGNFWQIGDQVSFGDHSEKLAYYASLNANRTNDGLAPPTIAIRHDAANGYGGFASFIDNRDAQNQFRLVTQLRQDYFQIPYDPDSSDYENQLYPSSGLRDGQHESDGLAAFTWTHTFNNSTLLQVSPFYHYNSANYEPNALDSPVATKSRRASNYVGAQLSISATQKRNNIQAGVYSWAQHDNYLFGLAFNDGSFTNFSKTDSSSGGIAEGFVSDNLKATTWLTIVAGLRNSRFQSEVTENVMAPRLGIGVQIPRLNWTLRGFYGRFYQPPPLLTASGPVIEFAHVNNTAIIPLRGERDEEYQFGLQMLLKGWFLDADTFQTRANNFLDHSNIGESSIYFPVTIDGALIQAWELTLRSPRVWQYGQFHLAYSNQIARQRGNITGGLICTPANSPQCDAGFDYQPVDHDQRNTLNVGLNATLPLRFNASANVYYGSGFTNGFTTPPSPYNGNYLPSHTTLDLSAEKSVGDNTTVSVTALNVANRRLLLDNSLTFGGFHYSDPRQIYVEMRYRFKY
jgi:hypothetical protein